MVCHQTKPNRHLKIMHIQSDSVQKNPFLRNNAKNIDINVQPRWVQMPLKINQSIYWSVGKLSPPALRAYIYASTRHFFALQLLCRYFLMAHALPYFPPDDTKVISRLPHYCLWWHLYLVISSHNVTQANIILCTYYWFS